MVRWGFYIGSDSGHQTQRYVVETWVSTTTWTSADTKRVQDLQGSSATSEEAQTDRIASVNKVVQQLISRIVVWLYKSYIRIGKLLQGEKNKLYVDQKCDTRTVWFTAHNSRLNSSTLHGVEQPCPTRRPRYTFLAPSVSTLFEAIININSNFKTKNILECLSTVKYFHKMFLKHGTVLDIP
jgi:hypothetical protein